MRVSLRILLIFDSAADSSSVLARNHPAPTLRGSVAALPIYVAPPRRHDATLHKQRSRIMTKSGENASCVP